MNFSPEQRENIKNPEQEVRQAFADFEIDLEGIDVSVLERLIEIHSEEDSHFYDAIEMAKMLDKNWEHLGLEDADKKKMLVCALLHDVGKPDTIPAKIIIETPFPIPNSEISSPIHISNTEPAVMTKTSKSLSASGFPSASEPLEKTALT